MYDEALAAESMLISLESPAIFLSQSLGFHRLVCFLRDRLQLLPWGIDTADWFLNTGNVF